MKLDTMDHYDSLQPEEAQNLPKITLNASDWSRLMGGEYDPNKIFYARKNQEGEPYSGESRIYDETGAYLGEIRISE